MKQSEESIRAAFSREDGARIFATLGDQEGQDLLQKYMDICALPMKGRKDAFRKASPTDASDLWRTHLALYLARHPELNEAQRQSILGVMSFASPEFFKLPHAKAEGQVGPLESSVHGIFSRIEGAKIFATLGEPDPSQTLKGSTALLEAPTKWKQPNRFIGRLEERKDCECTSSCMNTCWNYCQGTQGCTQSSGGCGFLWQCDCTAMCAPVF